MLSLVIPTYNEKENIESLIEKIIETLKRENFEIIIVDGNSHDGTIEIVEKLQKKYKFLKLVKEKKRAGIGSAYKKGFRIARGDIIATMDADFSHDPADIPRLIEKIKDYDIAIGSRYVKGGERADTIYRRFFPFIGNMFYKLVGIPASDATSGFKAYRRGILESINLDKLPNDFSFQTAIIFELRKSKIIEIPIEFRERSCGESKYSWKDLFGNMILLLEIIFNRM